MTTDLYPKARSAQIDLGNGRTGTITGIAKGAGMIEPNLATMLVFILTDIKGIDQASLQHSLREAVNGPGSFNRISVDSDQSTSDTVMLMSSEQLEMDASLMPTFQAALTQVCSQLAGDVVRNGEGVEHVIRVTIKGSPNAQVASGAGKSIVNSPLVKTAISGNDPNVGRVIMALGSYLGSHKSAYISQTVSQRARIKIGDTLVFADGEFQLSAEKEQVLFEYMSKQQQTLQDFPSELDAFVDIEIDLQSGDCGTVVVGGDLTHEYISVNADYRS